MAIPARLVFKSYKTGEERYAVILPNGDRDFLSAKGTAGYGQIGDEGVLYYRKNVMRFKPNAEVIDMPERKDYPMVIYTGNG